MTRKERYAADPEYRERIKRQTTERRERLRRESPEKFEAMQAQRRKGPRVYPPLAAEKRCTKCGESKPATAEFFAHRNEGRLKLTSWCKVCFAAHMRERHQDPVENAKHIAAVTRAQKKRLQTDPVARAAHNRRGRDWKRRLRADPERYEAELAKERAWRKANWDRVKQYKHKTGPLAVMHAMARHAAKLKRTPSWADLEAIEAFYEEAQRLTEETGTEHHVDHVIPLRGRHVSGLHVETNLQVIPASINKLKANRFAVA